MLAFFLSDPVELAKFNVMIANVHVIMPSLIAILHVGLTRNHPPKLVLSTMPLGFPSLPLSRVFG